MAPSILRFGIAALLCAVDVSAEKWRLTDKYDHTNFFDKFVFFESKYDPGNPRLMDRAYGHVEYQSKENALKMGLVKYDNNEVYIGADHNTSLAGSGHLGRPSVRLEAKEAYERGLFIARFTHLPSATCGSWPAFWSYGSNWPAGGEIDMYETWNDIAYNQLTFHTGLDSEHGQCIVNGKDQSASVVSGVCDNSQNSPPKQFAGQGCASAGPKGSAGSADGGIYAVEWTDSFIKLYAWSWKDAPANIDSNEPDTSLWGKPAVYLKDELCNIGNHFSYQRLVMNIDFCGEPAGLESVWGESCRAKTKQATCADFVSNFPSAFSDMYFKVKDIRIFTDERNDTLTTTARDKPYTTYVVIPRPTQDTVTAASNNNNNNNNNNNIINLAAETREHRVSAATQVNYFAAPVTSTCPVSTVTVTAYPSVTTSTCLSTAVHTVTGCPPWAQECVNGGGSTYIVTEIIDIYTTVLPLTGIRNPNPPAATPSQHGNGHPGGNTPPAGNNGGGRPGSSSKKPELNVRRRDFGVYFPGYDKHSGSLFLGALFFCQHFFGSLFLDSLFFCQDFFGSLFLDSLLFNSLLFSPPFSCAFFGTILGAPFPGYFGQDIRKHCYSINYISS